MKFSSLNNTGANGKPTSFHIVMGGREARQFSLADANNTPYELVFIPLHGGLLALPIIEKIKLMEYRGFRSYLCSNGKLFFGKLLDIRQNITWKTADIDKAEASFHAIVDRFCDLPD